MPQSFLISPNNQNNFWKMDRIRSKYEFNSIIHVCCITPYKFRLSISLVCWQLNISFLMSHDGFSVGKLQVYFNLHNFFYLPNPLSQYFNGKLLSVPGLKSLSDCKQSPSAFLLVKWAAGSYSWHSSALALFGERYFVPSCLCCFTFHFSLATYFFLINCAGIALTKLKINCSCSLSKCPFKGHV